MSYKYQADCSAYQAPMNLARLVFFSETLLALYHHHHHLSYSNDYTDKK